MWKPTHPLPGCDVFVLNADDQLLLVQRSDNKLWALPGGCQELGESPKDCAERECLEETGYIVKTTELLGVFSSTKYEYVHYPHKHVQFCHLFFKANLLGGELKTSEETSNIGWFSLNNLPELSDGHDIRIRFAKEYLDGKVKAPYFE
jgi:ADP-ribose pyrophosphatase YjhB (NUDIX family)